MGKLSVLNIKGEKVSDITLNKEIWGIEPNDAVLYDAIILARASMRQGTSSTKTRAEVSGGGRKPWKQKGTGRARQGSIRSPQWYHGGIVFGPKPRSYDKKQNRKERRLALKSALAYKAIGSEIVVLDNLNLESNKTKDMKGLLANLKIEGKTLIVTDELTESLILATRNLGNLLLLEASEINVLDLVSVDHLIITEAAVKQIEEVLV
ncbi:MAG: 50S ribosomal protein L4 [Bacilli bacterium]|nr:50S ribosomal protein L4 [Bacilli bacterium]